MRDDHAIKRIVKLLLCSLHVSKRSCVPFRITSRKIRKRQLAFIWCLSERILYYYDLDTFYDRSLVKQNTPTSIMFCVLFFLTAFKQCHGSRGVPKEKIPA